ncbi:MAG: glycerate kinase, partial [Clostridia bacterium]|nr:glycerate kinase [Clostridia bacterium]
LLGLGGSATNDCGACMASALGWKFFDENGDEINPVGGSLIKIRKTVRPGKSVGIPVTAACDVDNPLYGESGAAYVFAPQKGADESAVSLLDEGLRNIARVIENDTGMKVADIPGAGAAGGMGAGVIAFLGGELRRGIDIILDIARFDEKAQDADLIITGEGRLDSQSINGKVISGIAKRAKKAGKRVITICGCAGEGYEEIKNLGVGETYFSCPEPKPWDEVVKDCRKDLYSAALKAAEDFAKKYNKTTGLV